MTIAELIKWLSARRFTRGERFRYSQGDFSAEADQFLVDGEIAIVLLFDTDPTQPVVHQAPRAMGIITVGLRPFSPEKCVWGYDDRLTENGAVYLFQFYPTEDGFAQRSIGSMSRDQFFGLLRHAPL